MSAAMLAGLIMAATPVRAGDILKQVVNPGLAAQHAQLANQVQTAQALRALQTATQTYQASNIRGGGVMINLMAKYSDVPMGLAQPVGLLELLVSLELSGLRGRLHWS